MYYIALKQFAVKKAHYTHLENINLAEVMEEAPVERLQPIAPE